MIIVIGWYSVILLLTNSVFFSFKLDLGIYFLRSSVVHLQPRNVQSKQDLSLSSFHSDPGPLCFVFQFSKCFHGVHALINRSITW